MRNSGVITRCMTAVLWLACAALARPVEARPGSAVDAAGAGDWLPSPGETAMAPDSRTIYQAATLLLDQDRPDLALLLFEQSYQSTGDAQLLFLVALCAERLGRVDKKALDAYKRFLAAQPPALALQPARLKQARTRVQAPGSLGAPPSGPGALGVFSVPAARSSFAALGPAPTPGAAVAGPGLCPRDLDLMIEAMLRNLGQRPLDPWSGRPER